MKCGACGTELEKDARFCHICGQPAPPEPEKNSFCPRCGAGLPKIAVFCPRCGVALSEAGQQTEETVAVKQAAVQQPAPTVRPAEIHPASKSKKKKKKSSGIGGLLLVLLILTLIFGCLGAVLYVEASTRGQTMTEYVSEAVGRPIEETARWSDLETAETPASSEGGEVRDAQAQEIPVQPQEGLLTKDVCRIYLELLGSRQAAIERYDWQQAGTELPTRPVVLCDICGDMVPELIWVETTDGENGMASTLNIAGIRDGAAVILGSGRWDVQAGSGFCYYLFQERDDKTLYAYSSFGEETRMQRYSAYVERDGILLATDLLTSMSEVNWDGEKMEELSSYAKAGEEITAEEFSAEVEHLRTGTERILMYSADAGSFVADFISANGCPAMTGSGSIAFLSDCLEAVP